MWPPSSETQAALDEMETDGQVSKTGDQRWGYAYWLVPLEGLDRPTPYYLEYPNGNCSIVCAEDIPEELRGLKQREKATLIRKATADDIGDFLRMGGAIR